MRWRYKALAFRCLSAMPGNASMHYWLQRYVTRTLPCTEKSYASISGHAARFVELLTAYAGKPLDKCNVLEFGAGRDLTLALALRARGVGSVIAVDLKRLAKLKLVRVALGHVDADADVKQVESLTDLARIGVVYRAPFDMRATGLAAGSLDCVLSSEVMEHIPAEDLRLILRECFRVLSAGGLAIMKIDYSDHYARGDDAISRFNFLKYSDDDWRPYNSAFQYVNRLRHAEYLKMFNDAGFEILLQDVNRVAPIEEVVAQLADRFRHHPLDDLFVQNALIVARRP